MKLTPLLKDQKRELEDWLKNKKIINREAYRQFQNSLDSKSIRVITGVRRCGKSVLTHLFLQNKKFAYMNFDDERLFDFDTDEILSSFHEIYGRDIKNLFFDEIQNLDRWELFVNRLKRQGFNIYITGSNSNLLSKELATHLTGRHMAIELFPFSFREYLKAIDFKDDFETTIGKGNLMYEFRKYLKDGGFPETVIEKEEPKRYLRGLYSRIIERDIINRHDIAYKKTFKEIAMTLLSNPGRKISYNKLRKQFNIKSDHTVKNYVSYLEEAYLIFLLNRFSYKPVEIEKSEKISYAIDTGMINNVSLKSSQDYGRLYENVVALELFRKKSFDLSIEVYYWKNIKHEEVDFVIKQGLKVRQLIQVCYDISDLETKERELKALVKASKELKCSNLLIITEDKEGEEKIKGKKIKYIPLWKWLLKE